MFVLTGCTNENQVSDEDKGMSKTVDYSTPEQLAEKAGIPIYPNAHVPNGQSSVEKTDKQIRYEIVMDTTDDVDAVLKYYDKKLANAQRLGGKVMGLGGQHASVMVNAQRNADRTEIRAVAIVETGRF